MKIQCKDISDSGILNWLALRQGKWCNNFTNDDRNIAKAFPDGTPYKIIIAKMKKIIAKGYSGGCGCGCRGDYEITDKGLNLIGKKRIKPYTGY